MSIRIFKYLLKGHKSAVTWLCFSRNSDQIITASKDGSMRVWNINVCYHMDEDPKTLKVFPIPLHDSNGTAVHYDHLTISPDGKILAATHGPSLLWLCAETRKVLETADKAHDGDITDIVLAPRTIPLGDKKIMTLDTTSVDEKVKLWACSDRKSYLALVTLCPNFSLYTISGLIFSYYS